MQSVNHKIIDNTIEAIINRDDVQVSYHSAVGISINIINYEGQRVLVTDSLVLILYFSMDRKANYASYLDLV